MNTTYKTQKQPNIGVFDNASSYKHKHQVIVIGAGLSGLTAARDLIKKHGVQDVLILEALPRVGGRLHTTRRKIKVSEQEERLLTYDVGGQWVGPQQTKLIALMNEFGLKMNRQFITGKSVSFNQDLQTNALDVKHYNGILACVNPEAGAEYDQVIKECDEMALTVPLDKPWTASQAKEWDSMTVKTFMEKRFKHEEGKRVFEILVGTIYACDSSEVSFLYFLFFVHSAGGMYQVMEIDGGAQNFRIIGGAQQVPVKLAEQLGKGQRIRLNSPVKHVIDLSDPRVKKPSCQALIDQAKIKKCEGPIIVETMDGALFSCDYLISAMPPAIGTRIHFTPPLPASRDQFCQRMPQGSCIKFNMMFKNHWWRERGMSGCLTSVYDDHQYPVQLAYDLTEAIGFVGFMVGSRARYWADKTREQRRDAILRQFAVAYKVPEDYVKSQCIFYADKNWGERPFARGCYEGYCVPGALTSLGEALRKPVGRVHFASSETAHVWTGYMNGAIDAGERAAQEVAQRIKGTSSFIQSKY